MNKFAALTMTILALAAAVPAQAARTPADATVQASTPPVCSEQRVVFKLSQQWLAQLIERHGAVAPGGQIRIEIRGTSLNVYDLDHVYRYRVIGDDRVVAVNHDLPAPIAMPNFEREPGPRCS